MVRHGVPRRDAGTATCRMHRAAADKMAAAESAGGSGETETVRSGHDANREHPEGGWGFGVPVGAANGGGAVVQRAHRASPLSGLHPTRWRTPQVHGIGGEPAGGVSGLVFVGTAVGTARPLYWLEP